MDALNVTPHALISITTGLLILIMPKLLNYFVGIYLIVVGLMSLFRY